VLQDSSKPSDVAVPDDIPIVAVMRAFHTAQGHYHRDVPPWEHFLAHLSEDLGLITPAVETDERAG
jgi:hypothetical protein